MAQGSDRRRKPRQKLASNTELLWVTLHDVPGTTGEIRAKVIDMSEGGVGVEAPCALQRSEFILVQGLPGSAGQNAKVRVQVRLVPAYLRRLPCRTCLPGNPRAAG